MKYINATIKQFRYYEMLGTRSIGRLSHQDLFFKPNDHGNSIAMIVKHMSGNMLSRWTDFLTADGEKSWRNRDMEFADDLKTAEDVHAAWEAGWKCFYGAVEPLSDIDLEREITIRGQRHTILEAINRQLAHYAYHIGQVVLLAKIIKGEEWQSLSIPLGQSERYNEKKFGAEDKGGHFTDEFLDRSK